MAAARNFVREEHRERFVHEAGKKPGKLMARVCHQIEELFEARYSASTCSFRDNDACLLFSLTGRMTVTTWSEAMKTVALGGGGILIIDQSGKHFFAQSEGFPPPRQFAGSA